MRARNGSVRAVVARLRWAIAAAITLSGCRSERPVSPAAAAAVAVVAVVAPHPAPARPALPTAAPPTDEAPEEAAPEEDAPEEAAAAVAVRGVRGHVFDASSGEPLAGVTIIAEGPAITGAAAAITDEAGAYVLPLPRGDYAIAFYADDHRAEEKVDVADGAVEVDEVIPSSLPGGEVIIVTGVAPTIDQGELVIGTVVTAADETAEPREVDERPFADDLGAAADRPDPTGEP
jgi:hypothetical protein